MKISSYMKPECLLLLLAGFGGLFTVVNPAPGQGWTVTSAPAGRWKSVASSADGIKEVAAQIASDSGIGLIYTSSDSGATWLPTGASKTAALVVFHSGSIADCQDVRQRAPVTL